MKKILRLLTALFISVVFLSGCEDILDSLLSETETASNVRVHFIDVGQGDSILIESPWGNMLIDAGENSEEDTLEAYFTSQNISGFEYAVGTHPHSDHIGALDFVINNYDVANVIIPRKTHTTRTYENLIKAMQNKSLKPLYLKPEETFALGEIDFICYGPIKEYDNLNSNSVVLKMIYGDVKFIFAGDAEEEAEEDMISEGYDLSAYVYKVSHHGSRTSSSKEFVQSIAPGLAIISCGKNNEYGHPHPETLETLNNQGTEIYRTDESGTIILTTNGEDIDIYEEKTGSR